MRLNNRSVYEEFSEGFVDPQPSRKYSGDFVLENRVSSWEPYLKEELEDLCKLNKGWDGYDSPPVLFANADQAIRVLSKMKSVLENSSSKDIQSLLPNLPHLVPVSGGALQAEWHLGDYYIELYFDDPDVIRGCLYSETTDLHEDFVVDPFGSRIFTKPIIDCFLKVRELRDVKEVPA